MIYTILDIETTGLHTGGGDNILSFGFLRINSNFEIKASGTLYFYKPEYNMSNFRASAVHKLTTEFMRQHESEFDDNLKRMYSLCYNSTIIGKNSDKFDMPFIKNFIKRYGPLLPELKYNRTFDIQTEFSPTYKRITGSTKTGTLENYIDCLGITHEDIVDVYNSLPYKDDSHMHMHGALYDCVATFLVYKETCKVLSLNP